MGKNTSGLKRGGPGRPRGAVLPAVETMLWYFAKGKPVERHEFATPGDFSKLSDEELRVELEKALLFFPSAPTTV